MMRKSLTVALGIILFATPLCGQDNPSQLPEFTSTEAISAVKRYEEKLAFLDARLVVRVEDAQAALHADLKKALQIAVMEGDFPEVQRLSEFLQGSHAKLPKAADKAAQSEPPKPVVAADANTAVSLDDPEEVRKRFDLQLTAVKAQAIADLEQMARKAVADGQLDRAAEIWNEVITLDLGHQEAGKFLGRVKRDQAAVPADDNRNVWQNEGDATSGFMKAKTGWVRLTRGKPGPQLKEVGRTEHTITLQTGNDVYRLHRDTAYGRSRDGKWAIQGTGRWVR